MCSAKIAAHRQGEIQAAALAWQSRGGRVALLTLTMRHDSGQSLKALWSGLSHAWGLTTAGRRWQDDRVAFGVAGWVRVVEVTHGAFGWHVHVHALLFLDPAATSESVRFLGCSMFSRWRDALVARGFRAPLAGHGGLDVKLLEGDAGVLGDYFTKATYTAEVAAKAGLEVARGDLKSGRHGNRTPWAFLRSLVVDGDAVDLDLWHEWESGSVGRRQMTWSRGFRKMLRAWKVLDDEQTDEQVAEQTIEGKDLLVIPAGAWRRVCALRATARLLDAAEADDNGHELRTLLAVLRVEWSPPPG